MFMKDTDRRGFHKTGGQELRPDGDPGTDIRGVWGSSGEHDSSSQNNHKTDEAYRLINNKLSRIFPAVLHNHL